MSKRSLLPKLQAYVEDCIHQMNTIPLERKVALKELAFYISKKQKAEETSKLNFICTHNSRRSHFGQIWAAVAAAFYGIRNVQTYSGGTKATAFNPNAVAAITRAGFLVSKSFGTNPRYSVQFSDETEALECFSKTFDDLFNPQKGFAAIMTCSNADQDCPIVSGAEYRAAIMYEDPKIADDTINETATYDERCKQIATEMLYLFSKVK